jgi:hypothetical protein
VSHRDVVAAQEIAMVRVDDVVHEDVFLFKVDAQGEGTLALVTGMARLEIPVDVGSVIKSASHGSGPDNLRTSITSLITCVGADNLRRGLTPPPSPRPAQGTTTRCWRVPAGCSRGIGWIWWRRSSRPRWSSSMAPVTPWSFLGACVQGASGPGLAAGLGHGARLA